MASAEAPSGSGTPPQARNGNSPQSQPPIFPLAPTAAGWPSPPRPLPFDFGTSPATAPAPRWRLRLVEPRLTPRKRRPLEFVMTLTAGGGPARGGGGAAERG